MNLNRIFDNYDGDDLEGDTGLACKFCGKGGLHWQDMGSGLRLYDANLKRHECRGEAASEDDFEVVKS